MELFLLCALCAISSITKPRTLDNFPPFLNYFKYEQMPNGPRFGFPPSVMHDTVIDNAEVNEDGDPETCTVCE